MYSIRQESLFSLEQLLEMSPNEKYAWIFETLDITPFLRAVTKKSIHGAPDTLNYRAMIYSLFIRIVERMPFIKDLVTRLKTSEEFRYHCRFTGSDAIPSEAAYSRLIRKLQKSSVFQDSHDSLIVQAYQEGYLDVAQVAVDATHVEARDAANPAKRRSRKKNAHQKPLVEQQELLPVRTKEEVPPAESATPKKRGRKSKEEREQWLLEQAEIEAQKTIFEKTLEQLLPLTHEEIEAETPLDPTWGTKKNTDNKKIFWYGYKGHFAVDCKSQYILMSMFSSAHVNDGKMSIPLLKALASRHPYLNIEHVLLDAGYDFDAVYKQVRAIGAKPLIDYNKRNEKPIEGKDEHFRPVCKAGYAYSYDSFDEKYETLKYTRPKECETCPFKEEDCQKVFKIKLDTDIRKYTVPARGSHSYKELYKKRTAVERVNGYLKEFFQLNQIRHRGGILAKVGFEISCLVYTLSKLAVDRINKQMGAKKAAS
ncbi:MAG: transposase [Gorillibacterium sp.]|nr:transposase [Gorillibacterium sp.]